MAASWWCGGRQGGQRIGLSAGSVEVGHDRQNTRDNRDDQKNDGPERPHVGWALSDLNAVLTGPERQQNCSQTYREIDGWMGAGHG